jgi:hypothetical protein
VRRAYLLFALSLVTAFSAVAFADDPLLQFQGHSWERGLRAQRTEAVLPDADRSGAEPLGRAEGPGLHLYAVGELTGVANPLVWNPLAFSVSWSMGGLDLVRERHQGTTRIAEFSGGRITFFTDSPFASPRYGTNPPNATAPAEFEDGYSVYLDGRLSEVRLTFDERRGLGTLVGKVRFVGGDAHRLLQNPSNWIFSADLRRGSPSGYSFQILGTLVRDGTTTGVERTTWASVKELFR